MAFNTNNPVPSADAKDLSDNAENFDLSTNSDSDLWVNRLGASKDTVTGRIKKLGYAVPSVYTGGISFLTNDNVKTVEESGLIYAPLPASLPFTTSGTWGVIGVSGDNLKFFSVQLQSVAGTIQPTTTVDSKLLNYSVGASIIISDRSNHKFKYQSGRELIPGQAVTLITADDEVHILTDDGGMLVFDDWQKLPQLEAVNYTRYLAKLNVAGEAIAITNYGDSLTWGQAVAGQAPTPWPVQLKNVLNSTTENTWTNTNRAVSGDRLYQQYTRYPSDATTDITTIMLSTNDTLFATNNGENPGDVLTHSLYSIENYTEIMRKMVAREILRGNVCVVFGSIQISSASNGSLGIYAASLLSSPYDSAGEDVAREFGCMYVNTKRDVFSGYGTSESTYDGIHLKDEYYQVLGSRIAAVFLQKDFKHPLSCQTGSVMTANPLWNPISSDVPIVLGNDTDGTSPPLGGGLPTPFATAIQLEETKASNLTFAFYCPEDNMVIYPTVNNSANTPWAFNLLLDQGGIQADYPCDTPLGFPLADDRNFIFSFKSISKTGNVNRSTEFYSVLENDCYIHVTTKGWHYLTFSHDGINSNMSIESLVFDSIVNVVNNDIKGGISAKLVWTGGAIDAAKSINIDSVSFAQGAGKMSITFSKNLVTDNIQYIANSRDDIDHTSSHVQFNNDTGLFVYWSQTVANVTTLFTPDAATVYMIGGK